jgi:Glyceraldehyde 3-phosphate dehydrogenase, C-terminal domain
VDLVINVAKKGITAEDVNAAFRKAADGPLKGILAVCDVPLVSVDFRCSDVSSTIDSSLTMVMGDDMVKVVAWYDNEWGYRLDAPFFFYFVCFPYNHPCILEKPFFEGYEPHKVLLHRKRGQTRTKSGTWIQWVETK